jgi:serine/threonine protein phosphatase 1
MIGDAGEWVRETLASFSLAALAIFLRSDDQRNMFGKRPRPSKGIDQTKAATPPDMLIWAVGDIHGCADLLQILMDGVMEDVAATNAAHTHLVFLGDYIDRGPDSKAVLQYLSSLVATPTLSLHFLKGNHEERMEAFLVQPELGAGWSEFGGREALASYGLQPPKPSDGLDVWQAASNDLGRALTEKDRRFLFGLKPSVSIGDFFFAHAGAEPGVPLDQQDPHQLMWIRRRFLEDSQAFEKMVVHGHTPSDAVYADHRRIGIDTGAYATSVLTGLRLFGTDRQVLQTRRRAGHVDLDRSALA